MTSGAPVVWSSRDICAHFGISRTTLQRWRADKHFPLPLWWNPHAGGVWFSSDVRAWHEDRERPSNARRGAVVGRRRQGASIRKIALELGCSRSWVRKVLRDFGEYKESAA